MTSVFEFLRQYNSLLMWVAIVAPCLGAIVGAAAGVAHCYVNRHEAKIMKTAYEQKFKAQDCKLKNSQTELSVIKAKTVEVSTRLAPRVLTDEQRGNFFKYIKSSPKGKVALQSDATSQEAQNFAKMIQEMLTEAGFDVSQNVRMFIATSPRSTGITMKVKTDNPPPHAGVIQKGFESIGILAPCSVANQNDEISEDTPIIYIEKKP